MNENIDLTEILKDCPKGTELWSKAHGAVYFQKIDLSEDFPIHIKSLYGTCYLSSTGQYFVEGECLLVPSKDQQDWSEFSAPWYKNSKFDPKTLKPFDKVLCKNGGDIWRCEFFSCYMETQICPNVCVRGSYSYCIPYNDETKHLVGTNDKAPKHYQYWEDL